jgi:RNA polymerase sigma factor (sigma-70 family)
MLAEDKWIILRFNRGDRGALHRLHDKYKGDLVTLAAALLMDVSAAEDVVHDVFTAFLGSAGRFRLTGSLKSYLATCVTNRARNVNKAARRRAGVPLDGAPPPASGAARPDQAAIFGEQPNRLAEALKELPVRIEIVGTAETKAVRWQMDFKWSDAVDPEVFEPDIRDDFTLVVP